MLTLGSDAYKSKAAKSNRISRHCEFPAPAFLVKSASHRTHDCARLRNWVPAKVPSTRFKDRMGEGFLGCYDLPKIGGSYGMGMFPGYEEQR